jgi:hypothetical protein
LSLECVMVGTIGPPLKEHIGHEISAEGIKHEKYVERHLCVPKTDADPATANYLPDFSVRRWLQKTSGDETAPNEKRLRQVCSVDREPI